MSKKLYQRWEGFAAGCLLAVASALTVSPKVYFPAPHWLPPSVETQEDGEAEELPRLLPKYFQASTRGARLRRERPKPPYILSVDGTEAGNSIVFSIAPVASGEALHYLDFFYERRTNIWNQQRYAVTRVTKRRGNSNDTTTLEGDALTPENLEELIMR